jgi:hypothetical protein
MLHGYRVPWPSLSLHATCLTCFEAPSWEHTCGIYAVKEQELVARFGPFDIYGRVALSGLVIEHDLGYRAKHARIVELWTTDYQTLISIRRRHPGVPISLDSADNL